MQTTLPRLSTLPIGATLDGLMGYAYGYLVKVDPVLSASVFVAHHLAQHILFQICNLTVGNRLLRPETVHVITYSLVSLSFAAALRILNLIHQTGFMLLTGIYTVSIIGKIVRIHIRNEHAQAEAMARMVQV
ncbi:hypothetical protein [Candidatus Protochlamydia phocaeensis]|uniref:hypothetical protein n=1 Tax=Candidatus Protochlamydia phocaeensis TaxID=1414722 RepID=UPI0008390171|nr:hypothetical protein [Candidatus Protochlamydia phocaeensis]